MEKIKVTQQQRDNALEALNVMWPSVPPENVFPDLEFWRETYGYAKPSCKTIACFGGWCAWWPAFRRQGVRAASCGAPTDRTGRASANEIGDQLFGDKAVFNVAGPHKADKGFKGTDHELVTNRLRWLIENSTVVEPNKPRKTASGS